MYVIMKSNVDRTVELLAIRKTLWYAQIVMMQAVFDMVLMDKQYSYEHKSYTDVEIYNNHMLLAVFEIVEVTDYD